jgi:hypothetical protein
VAIDEIILRGPFTDEDMADLCETLRKIDERNPTGGFSLVAADPDATTVDMVARMRQHLPPDPTRETNIFMGTRGPVSTTEIKAGYWQNETSGLLAPAVEAYLAGEAMTGHQVAAMRAYLRQWIALPGFRGPMVDTLREQVGELRTRQDITAWLELAAATGIDPL